MTRIREATRIVSKDAAWAKRRFREFSCTDVRFSIQRRWSRSPKSPAMHDA
jgi:hypothetical protein